MKTALSCAALAMLMSCSVYDEPPQQAGNTDEVVGHRGGLVIYADDPPANPRRHAASITGTAPEAPSAPAADVEQQAVPAAAPTAPVDAVQPATPAQPTAPCEPGQENCEPPTTPSPTPSQAP